jgi:cyclopropane-fatty-acyl-phospholipid synthase
MAVSGGITRLQPSPQRVAAARSGSPARVTRLDRWLGVRVQRTIEAARVRLELWDGSSPFDAPHAAIGDLVVRDRRTLFGLALNPDVWFAEGYATGRVEIRGPFQAMLDAMSRASLADPTWRDRVAAVLAVANSPSGARRNVHHHYDLGNAFYERWLDPELVYTCAYFPDPAMPLEEAQRAKLDLVCRKLRLQPGETVVEAGCGWGALALHMARHYGVRVKAFNVSREQLAYARERAAREGFTNQVEFIDDDYRNVRGEFDAFVSVGMLEHVGLRHFSTLAEVLQRSVRRDGGRGLLHFIGRDMPRPLNAWIRRRIFPGAYPPTLDEVATRVLVPAGMSIVDVENLRLHYARTLAHWCDRFDAAKDEVRERFGEEFRRAWKMYLGGSQAAMATGWMQLFQVVFAPRESSPPFWTRADVYRDRED